MPPVTQVTPVRADIDLTGTELTIEMEYSIAAPGTLPASIDVARSNGIPQLLRTDPGGGALVPRLIVTGCDWEVDRNSDPRKMILRPRYRIHDGDRAVKEPLSGMPPVYTVSASAGLITTTDGLIESDSVSDLAVTNNSFVESDGWADIAKQGYDENAGHKTLWVSDVVGNDSSSNPFSSSSPIKTLARALAIVNNTVSQHPFPPGYPHRVLFARGEHFIDGSLDFFETCEGEGAGKRLWFGGWTRTASTARPKLTLRRFAIRKYTHVDGLEIEVDVNASGDKGALDLWTTASNRAEGSSAQDCYFPDAWNVRARNVDRCVLRAIAANTNPMANVDPSVTPEYFVEYTNIHIVNKTGGIVGHGVYESGSTTIGEGERSRIRDMVLVNNEGLRDSHRSRAEHGYCSLTRIVQDSSGKGPVGGVNLSNEGPWRMRNQTYRHIINFNPGVGADKAHASGLGNPRDPAGYWLHDSLTVGTIESSEASFYLDVRHTTDTHDYLLDVRVESISILRNVDNPGVLLTGISSSPQARCWRALVESVDGNPFVMALRHNPPGEPSSAVNPNWYIDYNVYVSPSTSPFRYAGAPRSLTQWRNDTSLAGQQQDANSQLHTSVEIGGQSSASYKPDLVDYDEEVLASGGSWPGFPPLTGSGSLQHVADAMESRPYREWDDRLSAEAMLRWAFRKYKPTSTSVWPSLGTDQYVGAVDYLIQPPSALAYSVSGNAVTLNWPAPSQARVTRHVVRYSQSTGPEYEAEVWNENSIQIAGLASGTWAFKVSATDGWSESDSSNVVVTI
jgi:hypothetical protein